MNDAVYITDDKMRFVRHFHYWQGRGPGDYYVVYECTIDEGTRRIGVFKTAHEAITFAKEGEQA